jgi:hypothetical protein
MTSTARRAVLSLDEALAAWQAAHRTIGIDNAVDDERGDPAVLDVDGDRRVGSADQGAA